MSLPSPSPEKPYVPISNVAGTQAQRSSSASRRRFSSRIRPGGSPLKVSTSAAEGSRPASAQSR